MKISVYVKTNKKEERVIKGFGDVYEVWVKEPAQEGRANLAMVRALSKYFGMAQSNIIIVKGRTSKHKTVQLYRVGK